MPGPPSDVASPSEASVHDRWLRETFALARAARAAGNHPFGALLLVDGRVRLTAQNSVHTDRDPTAHAETNLVRAANRLLDPDERARGVLYTSCEPCVMCAGAIYWSGIRSVVFGLDAAGLGELAGHDFLVSCRDIFTRALQPVEVFGPRLLHEARAIHDGYWHHPA